MRHSVLSILHENTSNYIASYKHYEPKSLVLFSWRKVYKLVGLPIVRLRLRKCVRLLLPKEATLIRLGRKLTCARRNKVTLLQFTTLVVHH